MQKILRNRLIAYFVGASTMGMMIPSIIMIQGRPDLFTGTSLSLVLMFGSLLKMGQTIFNRLPHKVSLWAPIYGVLLDLAIWGALYVDLKVFILGEVLLGGFSAMLYYNRNMVIAEILKGGHTVSHFMNTGASVVALGSVIGLGVSALLSKVLSPEVVISIGFALHIGGSLPINIVINRQVETYKDSV